VHKQVEVVPNGTGWDSTNNIPCKPRILPHLSAGTQDGQQLNKILKLKSQITNLEKTIIDLKRENFRQCQKNQQVKAPVSEKENSFTVSKVQSARIQQLEALVTSRERAILAFEASNKRLERELNNTLNLVDRLKREKNGLMIVKNNKKPTNRNTRMDWISCGDPYFTSYPKGNNAGYPTAYKSVSNVPYKGKTPSNASSKMNLQNLLISIGICLIVYKKPELIRWILKKLVGLSRTTSVYSLLSFRKIFSWSIFLIDIPLNALATK
jgi:hypothetical protein